MSPEQPVSKETDVWTNVQLARHRDRPHTLDYVKSIFSDFIEFHGDRAFRDDPAIVAGLARFEDQTVVVVGHQKGRDTKENIDRHFGMPFPEGYRKATRMMRQAERFGFPLITFIDTPGADPSLPSEERGQAEAIAQSLLTMAQLETPTLAIVIGEGGSGGALALGLADRVLMLEHAIYTVASPEAAASILWRNAGAAPQAAAAMRITAQDLYDLGVIDAIVPEPASGAQTDPALAAQILAGAVRGQLQAIAQAYGWGRDLDIARLLQERWAKFRRMGPFLETSGAGQLAPDTH
ncbi:MAG: acetyl-CoA carboxylase carboxyltransferase subunit alpha [Chloroflexi bacterium]|nr:acetyl-CoA carboxylase carboxyltransferase subunit alpha [Chloroflexota bacterium]